MDLWKELVAFTAPGVFNPWRERDPMDVSAAASGTDATGPAGRLARLKAHFDCSPTLILIGEAPGYQGAHFSGVPFTNEALLLKRAIPRIPVAGRLTSRPRPWCEPSATIMWGALHDLAIAEQVVLWNAFAWHPFKEGKAYSNRAPSAGELKAGLPVLEAVLNLFPDARTVAVGGVAFKALQRLQHTPYASVRHPAYGGAPEFRAGLKRIFKSLQLRPCSASTGALPELLS